MEFKALAMLINTVNEEITKKTEEYRLKGALRVSKFHALILQGTFAHLGLAEMLSASSSSEGRLRHSSLLEEWTNDTAILLMEITAYKTAVQAIQEKYFESHPILFKNFETSFEMIIQLIVDVIAECNDYRKITVDLCKPWSDHEQQQARAANSVRAEPQTGPPIEDPNLANAVPSEPKKGPPIDDIETRKEALVHSIVENWVTNAKFEGTLQILQESGKHEDFLWEHMRKKWNSNPEHNKEAARR